MAAKVLQLVVTASVIIAATQSVLQYAPLYDYSKAVLVQKTAPHYSFSYALKDDHLGNDFGHKEIRDGYDTKGHYYANLPGGSFQKVSYYVAGGSEFVPKVSYLKDKLSVSVPSPITYV